jgi:hypothetical protein
MKMIRVTAERWLRDVGHLWTETICILFDEGLADWFDGTLMPFVEAERLEGVWNMKPLIGGKGLAAVRGIRARPDIVKATTEVIDWQLEHRQGTVDGYKRAIGT